MKLIKFTTWRPNAVFEGLQFNGNGEFYANEQQAEILRKSRLIDTHDIEEIGEIEPEIIVELTEEEQARLEELEAKGNHTTPKEKAELKELKLKIKPAPPAKPAKKTTMN